MNPRVNELIKKREIEVRCSNWFVCKFDLPCHMTANLNHMRCSLIKREFRESRGLHHCRSTGEKYHIEDIYYTVFDTFLQNVHDCKNK